MGSTVRGEVPMSKKYRERLASSDTLYVVSPKLYTVTVETTKLSVTVT